MLTELSQNSLKFKAALKYCGSCNPYVDLARIAQHLAKVAGDRGDFQLVPLSEDGIEVVVILCGCPRACGNKIDVKARGKQHLLVAGKSLGGRAVPEADLPFAVERELARILES